MKLNFPFVTSLLAIALMGSCEKDEVAQKQSTSVASIDNYDKLHRFVSISFNIAPEDLEFDAKNQEFMKSGTEFKLTLTEVQDLYSKANVYKYHHEN